MSLLADESMYGLKKGDRVRWTSRHFGGAKTGVVLGFMNVGRIGEPPWVSLSLDDEPGTCEVDLTYGDHKLTVIESGLTVIGSGPVTVSSDTAAEKLTIEEAQRRQPWTVPYSVPFEVARKNYMPHLHATHATLHAMKSLGKLATIFEAMDHRGGDMGENDREVVSDMAADLFTVALRLANIYGFSLAKELARRVEEKNGVSILTAAVIGKGQP